LECSIRKTPSDSDEIQRSTPKKAKAEVLICSFREHLFPSTALDEPPTIHQAGTGSPHAKPLKRKKPASTRLNGISVIQSRAGENAAKKFLDKYQCPNTRMRRIRYRYR
jgi:hypothetical protein